MTNLLVKPLHYPISNEITLLHSVTKENSILEYIELKVLDLKQNVTLSEQTKNMECCCVVLTGKADIQVNQELFVDLGTRFSVFERIPTDSVYIGNNQSFTIAAKTDCQVLLAYAPTQTNKIHQLISAKDVGVESRGKYQNKRLVHNILTDEDTVSDKLLMVEVYTDSGNFSSYPPHKHDEDNLPYESLLEETYYHKINPEQGFVFQRVYTDDRCLDETMSVEHQNVVLVPKGYHPVGVPDGYSSYYFNVMAGPVKAWKFYDSPEHKWIIDRT